MSNLDLKTLGVQELDNREMVETDGGMKWQGGRPSCNVEDRRYDYKIVVGYAPIFKDGSLYCFKETALRWN